MINNVKVLHFEGAQGFHTKVGMVEMMSLRIACCRPIVRSRNHSC
jgi:hypothetical protein